MCRLNGMPSTTPSKSTTTTRIAKVPFLNSVAFYRNLSWEERFELVECTPRQLGQKAVLGEIDAGLLAAVDYFRLKDRFERLGHFGIAVRGRANSVLLFARRPLRQLDGAVISVTEQSSTSVVLLRLLLEKRYRIFPAGYEPRSHEEKRRIIVPAGQERRQDAEADALLLIGNDALQFRQINRQYPYEIDLGFEWWLWQHQPFTFAVWAVRKEVDEKQKKQIEAGLGRALATNQKDWKAIAMEWQEALAVPAEALQRYLESFVYRLGPGEEEGLKTFHQLADEMRLI